MQASRLDRVHIDVEGEIYEIAWDERDALLDNLSSVAGYETIIERFWAVGASTPVYLDAEQRLRLRVALELWGLTELPDGLADLLIALVRADPGGDVGRGHSSGD